MLTTSPHLTSPSVTVVFWHVNTFTHQEERFPATCQFVRKLSFAWGTKKQPQKAVSLLNILKLMEATQASQWLLIWQQRVWVDTRQSGTVPCMDSSSAAPLFAHLLWCIKHRIVQFAQCFTGFSPARSINTPTLALPATCSVLPFTWFLKDLTSGIVLVDVPPARLYSRARGSYHIASSQLHPLNWTARCCSVKALHKLEG